jgi:hypothetical protein
MKGEQTGPGTSLSDQRNPSEPAAPRSRTVRRRSGQDTSPGGTVRFFLSKADSSGVPSFDRELENESEAIVESLKTGRSYFVISEWKGLADLSKKVPLIRKEAITTKKEI